MKTVIVTLTLLFSPVVFAASAETTVMIHGSVSALTTNDRTSTGDFREAVIKGKVVNTSRGVDHGIAEMLAKKGFKVGNVLMQDPTDLKECKDAFITVRAGPGNFLPSTTGSENYEVPSVVSFACADVASGE